MPDSFDKATRSRVMSRIRSGGNRSTERRFRAALASRGVRGWIVRPAGVAGRPDILFPRRRVAVFLDGCFWHGCPEHFKPPSSNRAYWSQKIAVNRERDRGASDFLKAEGMRVVRLWEHELRDSLSASVRRVLGA